MGQKIHPTGFRLSVSRNWASRWYASNKDFAGMLAEDIKVREYLKTKLKNASVSRVLIERPAKNARITIFSARPGVVIGKKGEDIENLKRELGRQLGVPVAVNIEEVRKPETDAQLIAERADAAAEGDCAILDVVVRHLSPAVRPDDVLAALRETSGLTPPVTPSVTRLAQGPVDAQTGALADPLAPDRLAAVVDASPPGPVGV